VKYLNLLQLINEYVNLILNMDKSPDSSPSKGSTKQNTNIQKSSNKGRNKKFKSLGKKNLKVLTIGTQNPNESLKSKHVKAEEKNDMYPPKFSQSLSPHQLNRMNLIVDINQLNQVKSKKGRNFSFNQYKLNFANSKIDLNASSNLSKRKSSQSSKPLESPKINDLKLKLGPKYKEEINSPSEENTSGKVHNQETRNEKLFSSIDASLESSKNLNKNKQEENDSKFQNSVNENKIIKNPQEQMYIKLEKMLKKLTN